jgi:hypothetical protein
MGGRLYTVNCKIWDRKSRNKTGRDHSDDRYIDGRITKAAVVVVVIVLVVVVGGGVTVAIIPVVA